MTSSIILLVLAYLLGSIPTSIWVSKKIFHIDIRDYGSGNAGATNAFRFLGKKWGAFIFLIDLLKGTLAVQLGNLNHHFVTDTSLLNFKLLLGFVAIIGHIYPIWAEFKGGKGVATLFGVIIGISPLYAMIFAILFLLVFILTKYVALGSMLGACTFGFCVAFIGRGPHPQLGILLAILCGLMIIYTHRSNIKRLLNKTETKMYLLKTNKEKINKNKTSTK